MYDRSSHGRVRPNLSLSGQVSVGAKHRATPVLCPVIGRSRPRRWSWSLCLSAEALVHVAEATSIVAEATTLISIYTSECHLLALTMWKANQPARGRSSGRSTRRGGPRRRIHCCKYSLASSSALSCAERVLSLCSSRRRGRSRIAANCQACHPTAQQRGHLEITIEMEAQ